MHRFACAMNCIDGRVQLSVANYLKETYGVEFVDMVTEPGINLILADNTNHDLVASIERRVGVSVHHHRSQVVAIVGHPDCGGNPAGKEEQLQHLRMARTTVERFDFPVEIILLWANDDWKTVEVISPA